MTCWSRLNAIVSLISSIVKSAERALQDNFVESQVRIVVFCIFVTILGIPLNKETKTGFRFDEKSGNTIKIKRINVAWINLVIGPYLKKFQQRLYLFS